MEQHFIKWRRADGFYDKKHRKIRFVAAHPGKYENYLRHLNRMKLNENYYLDLSGYGLFRHGMLRRGIDEVGVNRFIFGSDFPTCNPAMYIGGILEDSLIEDNEKEAIMYGNAKKLMGLS